MSGRLRHAGRCACAAVRAASAENTGARRGVDSKYGVPVAGTCLAEKSVQWSVSVVHPLYQTKQAWRQLRDPNHKLLNSAAPTVIFFELF